MPPAYDDQLLTLLERLCALEAALTVDDVLRAAVEIACAATASPRGMAGLCGDEVVTAARWFDEARGWAEAPLRWDLDQGAPGRVCLSATPLVCEEVPADAGGFEEATEVLGLESFACIPLLDADDAALGFLEVGNAAEPYGPEHVRRLGAVARLTVARLGAVTGAERREAAACATAEACLGVPGLFSRDPEVVLAQTRERLRLAVAGASAELFPCERGEASGADELAAPEAELVAGALGGSAGVSADGRTAALPLATAQGVLAVALVGAPEPLDEQRLRLLSLLCESAAAALDLARLYAAQAEIADSLQHSLLPQEPPVVAGLDVAVHYTSASAGADWGGDFVDLYSRSPGTLAFAIGDVAGKGVDAMALSFMTKFMLRSAVNGALLSWPPHPGEALQELHTALLEQPEFHVLSERFVTALFGVVSVRRRTLQLASAGHPAPYVVRGDGVERPLLLTQPAIGVVPGAALEAYPAETVQLEHGDVVVLFTDGIAELRDAGGRFFEDEMPSVLAATHGAAPDQVVAKLVAAAAAFSARPPGDDLALLCVRLTGEKPVI